MSLGEIRSAGNRTQRKVELGVTMDNVSGGALYDEVRLITARLGPVLPSF
ncbi:hypothetical protein [Streptosporangium sp. NPDC049304]